MRLIAVAVVALGVAGCASLPSFPKDNLAGWKGSGLPTISHRTSQISMDTGTSLEGHTSVPTSANPYGP